MQHVLELRQKFKKWRRELPLSEQTRASAAVCTRVQQEVSFQQSQHIGLYYPFAGEIDLRCLLASAAQFYFPIIDPASRVLSFGLYHAGQAMRLNQFGIAEPEDPQVIGVQELDCLCVPLLAFDRQGHRLGMGAGYYDTTLSYRLTAPGSKPCLLGIAYAWQEVALLQTMPHDIDLDVIITDQERIETRCAT